MDKKLEYTQFFTKEHKLKCDLLVISTISVLTIFLCTFAACNQANAFTHRSGAGPIGPSKNIPPVTTAIPFKCDSQQGTCTCDGTALGCFALGKSGYCDGPLTSVGAGTYSCKMKH